MKHVHWVFGVCLFTSSCDVILNFNIGGSIRLCQGLMLFICLAALGRAVQDGRILWPHGSTAFSLWILVQFIFLPFSGVISIGLMFFVLLIYTFIGILAIVQLYGQSDRIEALMKVYLKSFVFVSAYGLLQFIGPLVHVTVPFTSQALVHGKLNRVNGFSFEPSFFATYMVLGWIMLIDLRLSKARIVQGRNWKWALYGISAVMFLSTSKTAWGIMLVELGARMSSPVWQALKLLFRKGKIRFFAPTKRTMGVVLLAIASLFVASQYLAKLHFDPLTFLQGTGIAGTASHSLNSRVGDGLDTWNAFKDSPFIGRSIGGVAVYRAARQGIQVVHFGDIRAFWGFPVILDVLVASGVFGIIPFLVYLYTCTFGALRLARHSWPDERAKWLRAMARAMIFEWIMLLGDQNLFRIYLWFHFTMVMVVAYHLEYAPAPELAAKPEPEAPYFPAFEMPATS